MAAALAQDPIGFIGLGVMGMPMARNLLKAGFVVHAFNRTRAKTDALADEGGVVAESPAQVAAAARIVITMLSDTAPVEDVLFGPAGVHAAARRGHVVIDMSTISPMATRDFSARLGLLGVTLLDAPVSGGQRGAIDGTLSFMVGGDQATFETCKPIFDVLGKQAVLVGDSGAGQIAKACNQAIIGVSLVGIAEALLMASKAGVDPARVREALLGGFAGGPILDNLGQRMLEHEFSPGFRSALHLKDLGIAFGLAQAVHSPALLTGIVLQLFNALVANGHADEDHAVIVTALEMLAGATLADEHR